MGRLGTRRNCLTFRETERLCRQRVIRNSPRRCSTCAVTQKRTIGTRPRSFSAWSSSGGLEAARYLLHAPAVSDGYTALERERLNLTVEAEVLSACCRPQFTAAEQTDCDYSTATVRIRWLAARGLTSGCAASGPPTAIRRSFRSRAHESEGAPAAASERRREVAEGDRERAASMGSESGAQVNEVE